MEGAEWLWTPAEVAALMRVEVETVNRWARTGRLESVRTPGGKFRFRESAVRAWLAADPQGRDGT